MGPGKLTAPLSAFRNVVSATLRFLQEYVSAFRPNVTLACFRFPPPLWR
jgi:hypothetical protein